MSDYVVKKEFGRRPGTILRFLGAGKHELEWVERSYVRTNVRAGRGAGARERARRTGGASMIATNGALFAILLAAYVAADIAGAVLDRRARRRR